MYAARYLSLRALREGQTMTSDARARRRGFACTEDTISTDVETHRAMGRTSPHIHLLAYVTMQISVSMKDPRA